MSASIFLDTNIWIYAYEQSDETRPETSRQLIADNSDRIILSTQNLGEIYNTLTRKQILDRPQAADLIEQLIDIFEPVPIQASTVRQALAIQQQTQYSYWDSLIVATAIEYRCERLYSEDLQHDRRVENLTIVNPFL
ncbi:MAG: PIN domain-containing protein [Geitlerinemataceae cyanobacterium]